MFLLLDCNIFSLNFHPYVYLNMLTCQVRQKYLFITQYVLEILRKTVSIVAIL